MFWDGDMLARRIHGSDACKMEIKRVNGFDFLLIERGGYGDPPGPGEKIKPLEDPNRHPGCRIMIRKDDRLKALTKK
jgi:hypothetical protein